MNDPSFANLVMNGLRNAWGIMPKRRVATTGFIPITGIGGIGGSGGCCGGCLGGIGGIGGSASPIDSLLGSSGLGASGGLSIAGATPFGQNSLHGGLYTMKNAPSIDANFMGTLYPPGHPSQRALNGVMQRFFKGGLNLRNPFFNETNYGSDALDFGNMLGQKILNNASNIGPSKYGGFGQLANVMNFLS